MLKAVITQEYVLYSSRPVNSNSKLLPFDVETVIVVPPVSVRTRLNVDMLLATEGGTHMKVMLVVPIDETTTEVGGEGLGGAVRNDRQVKEENVVASLNNYTYVHKKVHQKLIQTCMYTGSCQ